MGSITGTPVALSPPFRLGCYPERKRSTPWKIKRCLILEFPSRVRESYWKVESLAAVYAKRPQRQL